MNPEYVDAILNLAKCYRQGKQLNKASKCYERLMVLQPGCELALHNKALLMLETGLPKKALELVDAAILASPGSKQYYALKERILRLHFPESEEAGIVADIRARME